MEKFLPTTFNGVVEALSKLDGIGPKTARKIAISLLNDKYLGVTLANAVVSMTEEIKPCPRCRMIIDNECVICNDEMRDNSICVVENHLDIMTIESTYSYKGRYFVLGGLIAPTEGLFGDNLGIDQLVKRIKVENPNEVLIALSASLEGDATGMLIQQNCNNAGLNVNITKLARGIQVGNDLEYTDPQTISYALENRESM